MENAEEEMEMQRERERRTRGQSDNASGEDKIIDCLIQSENQMLLSG